ncbi:uridine kinase [Halobacillus andaensis]|uniref:Uridine kinase n=1 Tax=Halobacillus andaensis TaxID=1176239 RepID=A0A917EX85_HALAA|nr:AAA family ATPase [Halobacillus andaensis]MBP2005901.1 uridine kinase [Halobacillus andaensis]GGF25223.1 uridine kinase [Halobacillus andaensis]
MNELPHFNQTLTLIGIDGCGGSGKSTLAEELSNDHSHSTIIHMDDFYLPSAQRNRSALVGSDFDWERVLKQVIIPIKQGKGAHYQRYDWDLDQLAEWHTFHPEGIVIIEGCYSTRDELREYYDFSIWVDCPREQRLARGLERDGEAAINFWQQWMEEEDRYIKEQLPQLKVDRRVKGY